MKFTIFAALLFTLGFATQRQYERQAFHLDLPGLTSRALTALCDQEVIELPDGSLAPVVGKYDATRSIHYHKKDRPAERILVGVPIEEGSVKLFATFCFEPETGRIADVSSELCIEPISCSFQ
jgi:hypothetical protein